MEAGSRKVMGRSNRKGTFTHTCPSWIYYLQIVGKICVTIMAAWNYRVLIINIGLSDISLYLYC